MAVMYSKLGGCLGETAKWGPLARTDLCALVKGLLDRLMTHFGLGSSLGEEPWGLFCLLRRGEALASWELMLLVNWEPLAWEEPDWEALLSGWEIALSARGVLPAWELPAWELLFWEACKALSLAEHLTARAACLGDLTLCLGKSTVCQGSQGVACLGDHILCPRKDTVYWGGLGLACLGDYSLPEKKHCLPGKPACLLPEEKP